MFYLLARPMKTFGNSLDRDQAWQQVGLDQNQTVRYSGGITQLIFQIICFCKNADFKKHALFPNSKHKVTFILQRRTGTYLLSRCESY